MCQLVKRKSTSHIKKMMTICPRDASKPDHENCSSSEPATFSHVIGKSFARKFFPADSADAPGRKNFFARKDGRQAHRRRQVSFFSFRQSKILPLPAAELIQKSPDSHHRLQGLFGSVIFRNKKTAFPDAAACPLPQTKIAAAGARYEKRRIFPVPWSQARREKGRTRCPVPQAGRIFRNRYGKKTLSWTKESSRPCPCVPFPAESDSGLSEYSSSGFRKAAERPCCRTHGRSPYAAP